MLPDIDLSWHLEALEVASIRTATMAAKILLSRPISRSHLSTTQFWHHSFRSFSVRGTGHVDSAAHALGVLHGFGLTGVSLDWVSSIPIICCPCHDIAEVYPSGVENSSVELEMGHC